MKALLIHQLFLTPREAGGSRQFDFAKHCVASGDAFVVLASDVSYLDGKKLADCPSRERVDGVEIHRLRMPAVVHTNFVIRVVYFLYFMVKALLVGVWVSKHVDVVVGTTPPLFQAFSALVVAKVRRCPFVLEVRDLWPDFAIDMGLLKSNPLIYAARWLERLLYRHATQIIVNSPAYVELLVDKGVADARISLVANGVTPESFDPSEQGGDIRERYDLVEKFVITYAGAIGPANDVETIVEAASLLKHEADIHFLVVGDGKSCPAEKALAERLQLANITFTGSLPRTMMPEVLAASNACVAVLKDIPMFRTTYPNKVFDYMAAGRPTILAIDGVIREVIETCKGGLFVPPGDPHALCAAVLELRSKPDACRTMGSRARLHVEQHFNRADQAQQFRELLLLAVKPSASADG